MDNVKDQALKEISAENFREAVNKEKERLRNKTSLWDRLFPYKIIRKEEKSYEQCKRFGTQRTITKRTCQT